MGLMIILLMIGAVAIGLYVYHEHQEEERREAERQANRKVCVRCGRIHDNEIQYCVRCCLELAKQQKGRD